MADAVRCPYQDGHVMELKKNAALYYQYVCPICGARSPEEDTEDAAYSAAQQRYVEPNRVLTPEEIDAWDKASDCDPIWYEDRIFQSSSGWVTYLDESMFASGMYGRCWLRKPTDKEREEAGWG